MLYLQAGASPPPARPARRVRGGGRADWRQHGGHAPPDRSGPSVVRTACEGPGHSQSMTVDRLGSSHALARGRGRGAGSRSVASAVGRQTSGSG